jgi:ABC-type glycerol-3-phosphate transport system substrate-binding protein
MKRLLVGVLLTLLWQPLVAHAVGLTVWTRLTEEQASPIFDAFQKLHPEIDLHVEYIPGGKNHINKLMAAVAAKAPPDVTTLDVIGTAQFATIGALMPLDAIVAARPELSPDHFSPGQVKTGQFDGKLEALPFGGDVSVIYYNRDMFRATGLDPDKPPRTWDEFTRVAQKLSRAPEVYGFEIFPGYPTMTTFYGLPYLWMAGGTVLDPKTNLFAFNSEAGVRALTFLSDLHLKYHVLLPSAIGKTGDADVLLDFRQKRVAMVFGGPSQLQLLQRTPVDFDVGIMPHPSPSADTPSTSDIGGDNIAIMAAIPQDRLAAAVTLLQYATSADAQRIWWASKGFLPVRNDMLSDAYYNSHPLEKTLLAAYVSAHDPPRTTHYVEMQQYLRDAYQEIFLGQESPKQALDDAAAQANALIKRTGTP